MNNETIKQNVKNKNQWLRILYMILFAVILYFVMMLVTIVVIVQLLFALFSGKRNDDIAHFATDLSHYVYRIVAFLTYSDERIPFPFDNWKQDADNSQQPEIIDDSAKPESEQHNEPNQQ